MSTFPGEAHPRPRALAVTALDAAQLPYTAWASGNYAYDGSGNIEAIGADRFRYDRVSRLLEGDMAGSAPGRNQSYAFDTYGNLTSTTTDGVLLGIPASTSTNRLSGAVTYDGAGNLTTWNGQTYRYDVFNTMKSTNTGSEDWGYVYTADEERVLQVSGDGEREIWTLRDLGNRVLRRDERVGSQVTVTDYIYRGAQLLAAAKTDGSVEHFALDHLGTPRVITDGTGQVVAQHAYFPFGEEATDPAQDGQVMKFTGHERDPKSTAGSTSDDLDYMRARFCSPITARFHSVDSHHGSPVRPISWNRYAYARGNPLKFIDLTGLDIVYANEKDRAFYEAAAARNFRVRTVLDQFAPAKGKNLTIRRDDPGVHPTSGRRRAAMTNSIIREATPDELRTANEKAGGGKEGTKAAESLLAEGRTLREAEIILGNDAKSKDKLHELGHVDQALRDPEGAIRDAEEAAAAETDEKYRESASEAYADLFAASAAVYEPEPPQ